MLVIINNKNFDLIAEFQQIRLEVTVKMNMNMKLEPTQIPYLSARPSQHLESQCK